MLINPPTKTTTTTTIPPPTTLNPSKNIPKFPPTSSTTDTSTSFEKTLLISRELRNWESLSLRELFLFPSTNSSLPASVGEKGEEFTPTTTVQTPTPTTNVVDASSVNFRTLTLGRGRGRKSVLQEEGGGGEGEGREVMMNHIPLQISSPPTATTSSSSSYPLQPSSTPAGLIEREGEEEGGGGRLFNPQRTFTTSSTNTFQNSRPRTSSAPQPNLHPHHHNQNGGGGGGMMFPDMDVPTLLRSLRRQASIPDIPPGEGGHEEAGMMPVVQMVGEGEVLLPPSERSLQNPIFGRRSSSLTIPQLPLQHQQPQSIPETSTTTIPIKVEQPTTSSSSSNGLTGMTKSLFPTLFSKPSSLLLQSPSPSLPPSVLTTKLSNEMITRRLDIQFSPVDLSLSVLIPRVGGDGGEDEGRRSPSISPSGGGGKLLSLSPPLHSPPPKFMTMNLSRPTQGLANDLVDMKKYVLEQKEGDSLGGGGGSEAISPGSVKALSLGRRRSSARSLTYKESHVAISATGGGTVGKVGSITEEEGGRGVIHEVMVSVHEVKQEEGEEKPLTPLPVIGMKFFTSPMSGEPPSSLEMEDTKRKEEENEIPVVQDRIIDAIPPSPEVPPFSEPTPLVPPPLPLPFISDRTHVLVPAQPFGKGGGPIWTPNPNPSISPSSFSEGKGKVVTSPETFNVPQPTTSTPPPQKVKKGSWSWFTSLLKPKSRSSGGSGTGEEEWNPYPTNLEDSLLPSRLSDDQETYIYSISHIKLAQPNRSLVHQVQISNFMMYILSVHSSVTIKGRGPQRKKRKKKGRRRSLGSPQVFLVEGTSGEGGGGGVGGGGQAMNVVLGFHPKNPDVTNGGEESGESGDSNTSEDEEGGGGAGVTYLEMKPISGGGRMEEENDFPPRVLTPTPSTGNSQLPSLTGDLPSHSPELLKDQKEDEEEDMEDLEDNITLDVLKAGRNSIKQI